ncbi:MAG TPA: exo-alpha-sialidase, partial [bacterium]|nr:exo-alpha-sialidase [bacterium]
RVFLVYGYRHQPFGIRARILNSECSDFKTAEEIVLRDDGGSTDLGYPWAAMLPDGRILAVYYFNLSNGTRQIAGTFITL